MSQDCIFCKIVSKEVPADILFEDEDMVIFKDINPQAPTHLLVIPKVHIPTFSELDDVDLMGKIFTKVNEVSKDLQLKDYRVVINNGKDAGQEVFHLHVHIFAGRTMSWPPG